MAAVTVRIPESLLKRAQATVRRAATQADIARAVRAAAARKEHKRRTSR